MAVNPYHESLLNRLQLIQGIGSDALQRQQQMVMRQRQQPSFSPMQEGGGDGGFQPAGNFKPGTREALIAFGKQLQGMGYTVGENPAFGNGRVGKHSTHSRHYSGNAIDVNAGAGTSPQEQAKLRAILGLAKKYGLNSIFMQPGHYNHAHFDVR